MKNEPQSQEPRDQVAMTPGRVLGQRIHAFSNIISSHFYARTEVPFGISLSEWRVLRSVILSAGTAQTEIASWEGLNVMNVSRAVAGLKRKGLVEIRQDPSDRRRTMLFPTERGADIGLEIAERERLVYDHVFDLLSDEELAQLDGLLGRVNEALRERTLPDPPAPTRDWAAVLEDNSNQA